MHESRLYLDEWALAMTAEQRSSIGISERLRVVTQFGQDTGIEPCHAQPVDIVEWINSYRAAWSIGTACTYHGYVKAWFLWLQLTERRVDNPMLKVGRPRALNRKPRPVSDDGVMRLLQTPMHHRTRVMILLAVLAGLTVSEIAAVVGEHVDLRVPSIWVVGKNRKERTVPLHPLLVEAAATMPSHGVWFPANSMRPGEHVLGKSVSRIIGRAMRRGEVAGTPHKLRHWYGTTLLQDGADIRTVQGLLRHALMDATQIYTKVADQRGHDAFNRLDPFRPAA